MPIGELPTGEVVPEAHIGLLVRQDFVGFPELSLTALIMPEKLPMKLILLGDN